MERVLEVSREELQEMVEAMVEQKLLELLGEPETDHPVKKALRERLLLQRRLVEGGERGVSLEEAIESLGLGDTGVPG